MVTIFPHKKEQGHCFKIHGQERYLQGGLLLWTGDTLGSNCVSCFKEGVGGPLRICRHCMGTKEETGEKVNKIFFLSPYNNETKQKKFQIKLGSNNFNLNLTF